MKRRTPEADNERGNPATMCTRTHAHTRAHAHTNTHMYTHTHTHVAHNVAISLHRSQQRWLKSSLQHQLYINGTRKIGKEYTKITGAKIMRDGVCVCACTHMHVCVCVCVCVCVNEKTEWGWLQANKGIREMKRWREMDQAEGEQRMLKRSYELKEQVNNITTSREHKWKLTTIK